MNIQEKNLVAEKLLRVIRELQSTSGDWVDFARIGAPLGNAGIQYKEFGFQKLRPFLNEFQYILEFKDYTEEGKPPVYYVRPKNRALLQGENTSFQTDIPSKIDQNSELNQQKKPSINVPLFDWAFIYIPDRLKDLAELALDERWDYGEASGNFPILRNYLTYTFKRLCFEDKILIEIDPESNEEYSAFNTGLVDKTYEYIYALFRKNSPDKKQYWRLDDFVVAGKDKGKLLVKLFNPLPEKANYFENKIENMLYDTSTGELSCDYDHILTEHTERLPRVFLEDNCPANFLCIDNVKIDDIYDSPKEIKDEYFDKLGKKIKENSRILNRLKNRLDDAVELAKKRVEWNYKTAIPMYYPKHNKGSLLLPLALMDDDCVDLALVVERQFSGAYLGHTVLPLDLAYNNSRLVTRPDSDWLKTELISTPDSDDFDNE